ncbi:hypothetical protein QR680_001556 [Steinernema hermaphroditum]|uniref:Uncharacterized protein n=1 Tax=Steinernema hermaphroditum TaxID=289476 RepID=A0AA39LG66_9BILA|nr:hypothetical protein QR680_001556 [Steinernema hermaphroditum]
MSGPLRFYSINTNAISKLLRLGLAACAVVFLLIWFAISKVSKAPVDEESEETDEVVKILLLTDTGNGAADGIQNPPPKITFNVAVVLVVSLLSVVLLITGIIVLAVTLDPNSQNEDEDDVESYGDDYVGNSFRSMWFEAHTIADISDEDYNDPKHHHKYAHDDGLHDHVYNYSINDKQYYYHKRYNDNDNHNYNYNHNHHVRRQYDNNGKQFDDIELYGIYNH